VKLIAFSFEKNISEQVLKGVNLKRKYVIASNNQDIDKFTSVLVKEAPDYI